MTTQTSCKTRSLKLFHRFIRQMTSHFRDRNIKTGMGLQALRRLPRKYNDPGRQALTAVQHYPIMRNFEGLHVRQELAHLFTRCIVTIHTKIVPNECRNPRTFFTRSRNFRSRNACFYWIKRYRDVISGGFVVHVHAVYVGVVY